MRGDGYTRRISMSDEGPALDWPVHRSLLLTIDSECDFGNALAENAFQALDHTEWLVSLLERLDIPLTSFPNDSDARLAEWGHNSLAHVVRTARVWT